MHVFFWFAVYIILTYLYIRTFSETHLVHLKIFPPCDLCVIQGAGTIHWYHQCIEHFGVLDHVIEVIGRCQGSAVGDADGLDEVEDALLSRMM